MPSNTLVRAGLLKVALARLIFLLPVAAAVLPGCASNPVTGSPDLVFQSEAGEIKKSKEVHPMLLQQFGGAYDDAQLAAYVNEVGQRAAKASQRPELQYTFTVLDSEEINAFTTGGGYVYITRGIMNYLNNEAELEAVLGHEIGHVCARHPVRQQSKSTLAGIGAAAVGIFTGSADLAGLANYAGAALVSGYGRDQELEADRLGAEYLVKTGYSPGHMVDVVRLLKNQELVEIQRAREEKRQPHVYHGVFASHPDNDSRLHEVVEAASSLKGAADPRDPERDKYLRTIEGLPVGTSRAQGVLKGNRFYHSNLGMTIVFPSGWHVENRADSLVAISPNKESVIQMQTQAPPPNTGPREFLGRMLAQYSAGQAETLEVNGLAGLHDDRALGAHQLRHRAGPLCGDLLQQSGLRVLGGEQGLGRCAVGRPAVHVDHQDLPAPETERVGAGRAVQDQDHPRHRRHAHRRPGEAVAAAEVRGTAAAAAERPVPGQGTEAGSAHQDRRIAQRAARCGAAPAR